MWRLIHNFISPSFSFLSFFLCTSCTISILIINNKHINKTKKKHNYRIVTTMHRQSMMYTEIQWYYTHSLTFCRRFVSWIRRRTSWPWLVRYAPLTTASSRPFSSSCPSSSWPSPTCSSSGNCGRARDPEKLSDQNSRRTTTSRKGYTSPCLTDRSYCSLAFRVQQGLKRVLYVQLDECG